MSYLPSKFFPSFSSGFVVTSIYWTVDWIWCYGGLFFNKLRSRSSSRIDAHLLISRLLLCLATSRVLELLRRFFIEFVKWSGLGASMPIDPAMQLSGLLSYLGSRHLRMARSFWCWSYGMSVSPTLVWLPCWEMTRYSSLSMSFCILWRSKPTILLVDSSFSCKWFFIFLTCLSFSRIVSSLAYNSTSNWCKSVI